MATSWSTRGGRGEGVARAVKEGDSGVGCATVTELVGGGGSGGGGGSDGGGGGRVATALAILHRLERGSGGNDSGDLASLGLVGVVNAVDPGGELLVTNDDVPAAEREQVSPEFRTEKGRKKTHPKNANSSRSIWLTSLRSKNWPTTCHDLFEYVSSIEILLESMSDERKRR